MSLRDVVNNPAAELLAIKLHELGGSKKSWLDIRPEDRNRVRMLASGSVPYTVPVERPLAPAESVRTRKAKAK
jgi:hypothetical protein